MRLNLSPEIERYELFAPASEHDTGVAIWARPALSHVVEEATSDETLTKYAEEIRGMIETEEGVEELTAETRRTQGRFGVILAKAIARLVIDRWEGVEDPDGTPAPVSDDRVNAFLDHPAIYRAFTEEYLARWFAVQAEKKGSAPSPNGTTAAARNTAKPARKSAKSARAKKTARKR